MLLKATEEVDLKINEDKTKYMMITGRLKDEGRHFKVRTERGKLYTMEKVNNFTYLEGNIVRHKQ